MITAELKNKIDKIWGDMWAGGITNPLTVIEQLTYLIFIKSLDDREAENRRKEIATGRQLPRIFPEDRQHLRWSNFKEMSLPQMYETVRHEVFPFIKELSGVKDSAFAKYMKDAVFIIPTAQLLGKAVAAISGLPLKDRDLKGDIYEYMLSKIQVSGQNGQFRTPRHIIRMMVELMQPKPDDVICDPACGTGGFLLAASEYLLKNYPDLESERGFLAGKFSGFDTDQTMLRIAAMNMLLHNIETPDIAYKDALSAQNTDRNKYSLILANPPFTGSLDYEGVAPDLLEVITTKKTELLFLALFIKSLKNGGRCASIVPSGVLFRSAKAYHDLRKELVEHHCLVAVISMPAGVFKPYAGVSTAILIFIKTGTGGTSDVWFYNMEADGFSLDDRRHKIDEDDIPDIIERFKNRNIKKDNDRQGKCFFVSKEEIAANGYDLSFNKYKKVESSAEKCEHPLDILRQIEELEEEITSGIKELRSMLL